MNKGMPMEKAPAPAQPEQQGGGASELFIDIVDKMLQASDLLAKAKGVVSPEEQQAWAALTNQAKAFVEQNLAQAPGAKPPGPNAPGSVPMEAGANPKARPM